MASNVGQPVVGLDLSPSWLRYAAKRGPARLQYIAGDAAVLPFRDGAFDLTIAVTALCFVTDQRLALRELVRVTRRRFAVGLLNRRSLLWRHRAGHGGYAGAHWHTSSEVRTLFQGLNVCHLRVWSGIFCPSGTTLARALEAITPRSLLWGGFLLATGEAASGAT